MNPNDPAFDDVDYMSSGGHVHDHYKNLTKREYFAAMAMQGIISSPSQVAWATERLDDDAITMQSDVAKLAKSIADALIAELSK